MLPALAVLIARTDQGAEHKEVNLVEQSQSNGGEQQGQKVNSNIQLVVHVQWSTSNDQVLRKGTCLFPELLITLTILKFTFKN